MISVLTSLRLSKSLLLSSSSSRLITKNRIHSIRMSARDISHLDIFYYNEVDSTMDKARELIKSYADNRIFSVIAGRQNMGRGTRGRKWLSSSSSNGNLYMTVAYKISDVPIPLTLMPLRIATLIAPCIENRIKSTSKLYLKWPNDVLIDNEKVCGILIEIENNIVLVGIGCNVCEAPMINTNGIEGGRPSTCLKNHNMNIINTVDNILTSNDNKLESLLQSHPSLLELAVDIVESINTWLQNSDTTFSVIKDFENKMSKSTQRIRQDRLVDQSLLGKEIKPLRLNDDGSLQVYIVEDNKENTLVADYLW